MCNFLPQIRSCMRKTKLDQEMAPIKTLMVDMSTTFVDIAKCNSFQTPKAEVHRRLLLL